MPEPSSTCSSCPGSRNPMRPEGQAFVIDAGTLL
jgi:hypothetical protein